jgi:diadenosine tetraphosphate (Ap4A) HIT family hydrolase
MTEPFQLHSRLAADCITVGRLPLSLLLLLNDARYPWFLLVPQRAGMTEVFDLPDAEQQQLCHESVHLSRCMKQAFHADKMNVGVLGNLVPQLHVHHVARFSSDPAWPGPVWGHSEPEYYDKPRISERLAMASDWFGDELEMI